MTERLHFHFSLSCIGEGKGNPLQCSCLENPRDGGAWWAAFYGVTQSRTQLKRLSSSSSSSIMLLKKSFNGEVIYYIEDPWCFNWAFITTFFFSCLFHRSLLELSSFSPQTPIPSLFIQANSSHEVDLCLLTGLSSFEAFIYYYYLFWLCWVFAVVHMLLQLCHTGPSCTYGILAP